MYASIMTRPDITHAINMLTRFMQQPQPTHLAAANRVLRYLASAKHLGLHYQRNTNNTTTSVAVSSYCDSDWGGDSDDRKSTTGYCVFVNDCLVSWSTKKQPTVALSSAEAELVSLVEAAKEVMMFHHLLTELQYNIITPSVIHVDNQSAMKIVENDTMRERTKHIDIKHHFIKEAIKANTIKLSWIESKQQIADIFTKALPTEAFNRHTSSLITNIEPSLSK
jgi:hypothetical protein